MNPIAEDILMHYGMPRRSGRYPWGSGDNPYQHSGDFLSRVEELRKQGFTFTDKDGKTWTGDTAIAKYMELSTTQFRSYLSVAKEERRSVEVATAKALKEKGYSNTEIARQMGYEHESSIRSLLNEDSEARMNAARKTAEFIKEQVDKKGFIDVGAGTELNDHMRVSKEKWEQALTILEAEGYPIYSRSVSQVTNPGKQTTLRVICPLGTEHKDIYDLSKIHSLDDYISYDNGESFRSSFEYPSSMDSKRLKIRYAEEGGDQKDGVIEIRRGVDDLSLGESHYAQVRILVDGNRYLKGMAVYSDDLPDGVDVVFNTNKKQGTAKEDVLKPITNDPQNPFGSLIKEHGGQSFYDDPNGKYTDPITGKKQSLSLINKRAEEGDWQEWDNRLPSQFLSKQSRTLIKKQLDLTAKDKVAEFDEICSLNNPTVKKVLLNSFADDCDAAAVHLKAAALPRQSYKVILPVTSLKDDEVYAPTYKNGETVALVRYPHGGTFEIPVLTVNNKHQDAKKVLGNTLDAVGINSEVARRLSGADFDGDTVMIVPCNSSTSKTRIVSTHELKGLKDFDPKGSYGPDTYKGKTVKLMTKANTENEMGRISNLITDMTLKGATEDELARAVRHSMVVIDAAKHKLNYKQSEKDNDIVALKKKYQAHENDDGFGGASTLISRAKSEERVEKRKGSPQINQKGKIWYDPDLPEGALIWKSANETYVDKTGKTKTRTQVSTKMAETRDAFTLVSEAASQPELLYADYANKMKGLANRARKEMVTTGKIEYKAAAKETYQAEVDSLLSKLNLALKNAPRERHAQIIANTTVEAKRQANPDMSKSEIKKASQQALMDARNRVGAQRSEIVITDREWEAIQAGAISENRLLQILNHANIDKVRERATPRTKLSLSNSKVAILKQMNANGYTIQEIANRLGVSTSTVSNYLKGKE